MKKKTIKKLIRKEVRRQLKKQVAKEVKRQLSESVASQVHGRWKQGSNNQGSVCISDLTINSFRNLPGKTPAPNEQHIPYKQGNTLLTLYPDRKETPHKWTYPSFFIVGIPNSVHEKKTFTLWVDENTESLEPKKPVKVIIDDDDIED